MFIRLIAAVLPAMVATAAPVSAATPPYRVVEVTGGLAHPWSLAFLPDGDLLVSERNGGLRIVRSGLLDPEPVAGVPSALAGTDGGLLGLALHPQFVRTRLLYLCLSVGTPQANASRVIRARFDGRALQDVRTLFTAKPWKAGESHFGCRLMFAPDGKLWITLGDGYDYMREAQSLTNHLGKVVRLNDDGSIPADNPFVARADALPEIYSYGHRNVQGIALRPGSSEIWTNEHGPKGGDEVNRMRAGANYGWPAITFGVDYSGAIISDKTTLPGMEEPLLYWVPSIAPSGMAFYSGDRFPMWRGDLFVAALAARELRRIDLEGDRVIGQESLLQELKARLRDVRCGADGYVYVLTDETQGRILRLEPVG
jgi:aldose sugar dehydrogenase